MWGVSDPLVDRIEQIPRYSDLEGASAMHRGRPSHAQPDAAACGRDALRGVADRDPLDDPIALGIDSRDLARVGAGDPDAASLDEHRRRTESDGDGRYDGVRARINARNGGVQ